MDSKVYYRMKIDNKKEGESLRVNVICKIGYKYSFYFENQPSQKEYINFASPNFIPGSWLYVIVLVINSIKSDVIISTCQPFLHCLANFIQMKS